MARNKTTFEPGRQKTGGRKKGTPNKRTTDIQEILNDINPVARLETILNSTEEETLKVKICLDLLPYMYPKRKALELETKENIKKRECFLIRESECTSLEHVLKMLREASTQDCDICFITLEKEQEFRATIYNLADYS